MNLQDCRVLKYSSWTPSLPEKEPDITFTDPRFRRRLSMVSRMTIRVLHDLMPLPAETKIYFISFRGELSRQFKINKTLVTEGDIKPADFSLSVFNAPPALASMALGLTAGYSAVYPGKNNFRAALLGAAACAGCSAPPQEPGRLGGDPAAPAHTGQDRTPALALVYADEELPGEYLPLMEQPPPVLAFAALLHAGPSQSGVPLPLDCGSPETFLYSLMIRGDGGINKTAGARGEK
ncbi:MAG: beta-ketoacyl synthase chain length factor [Spirochaetaceae bacterium]|jgi:hypothetical protein|nr:beta-ketoacyl synthase chain length factor [Spirochaetaceae bacterium]